jgi:8-oxo-dGTP pyrophosphatase MutT (NUDIX family)
MQAETPGGASSASRPTTISAIKPIRTAARAVIICNGRLLATKMRDQSGVYYILPGGGQRPGETLPDAVRRECREECGIDIIVERLLFVREYIGKHHHFSRRHADFHQLEHVFLCRLPDPLQVCPGQETDNRQVGVNWLALENIQGIRFYPESLKPHLRPDGCFPPALYLGDCN